jgi:hypothetical protein
MSRSEIVFQLVCYMLPSIAFFASAWYFTNKWNDFQRDKLKAQNALAKQMQPAAQGNASPAAVNENKRTFFPLQVDATQRLVLFLERIAPNNMVMRLNNPGLPARAFQQLLLENIRSEYEHNLAQQIFVSPEAWNMIRSSKEELVKIINIAAQQLPPTATCLDLSRGIFEITAQLKSQPTERAINYLKAELNQVIQQG